MNITITRQRFVDRDACDEGLDCLDELVEQLGGWTPEGTVSLWWDWVAYVWALLSHPSFVIWALEERLLPSWDLRGADLYGANLSGANLDLAVNKDKAIGLPTPPAKPAEAPQVNGATP